MRNTAIAKASMYDSDNDKWQAVTARDKSADGSFFYSVATTGVYCRPSCGARQALRQNVAFHATQQAAEAAGFRPCKRCKPDQSASWSDRAELVARACRLIESAETPPALAELADAAGLSPHHFHRVFRSVTGVTPKAYAASHRSRAVKGRLRTAGTVTEAIFDAGYNANSRFYSTSASILGMSPRDFKAGGKGQSIRYTIQSCSLGLMLLAATTRGVCAIQFGDERDALIAALERDFPGAVLATGDAEFEAWVKSALALVDGGPRAESALPLDIRGTAFQQRVWQALQQIPAGTTASYTEVAQRIGSPAAVRAVAQACASNRIAVAIPCHRVVRADGNLSGYRWGVARKRELLRREGGG